MRITLYTTYWYETYIVKEDKEYFRRNLNLLDLGEISTIELTTEYNKKLYVNPKNLASIEIEGVIYEGKNNK